MAFGARNLCFQASKPEDSKTAFFATALGGTWCLAESQDGIRRSPFLYHRSLNQALFGPCFGKGVVWKLVSYTPMKLLTIVADLNSIDRACGLGRLLRGMDGCTLAMLYSIVDFLYIYSMDRLSFYPISSCWGWAPESRVNSRGRLVNS